MQEGRIYPTPSDGQRALQARYEYWTAKINDHSFQVSISLIAANWAVHSSFLTKNTFAVLSISFALLTLLISLGASLRMSLLHYKVFYEAENDKAEWKRRWQDAETNKVSTWPFNHDIICLGKWLAWLKTLIPCISAIFFVLGTVVG